MPPTIMTRLPVLFLRKANMSGTFESLKAKTLGCGEWTVVPIQLFPRDLRWRSCEGTREGGAVCEARPRHPDSARGLQAATWRWDAVPAGQMPRARRERPGHRGVEVPLSSRFPLQSRLPLSPRSPSAYPSPTLPATTHKVEGSFHHFHRPRGERRPEAERRRPGTWRGSEGRETRRLAGGSSQNPEPAVRAQERGPRHFRLRRRAAGAVPASPRTAA